MLVPAKRFDELRDKVTRAQGARDAAVKRLDGVRQRTVAQQHHLAMLTEAHAALQVVTEVERERVIGSVEQTATRVLQAIFNKALRFVIDMDTRAGLMTARFYVERDTEEGTVRAEILDGQGGGIGDVLAFVLRIMVIAFTPGLRPIVFLDEPFHYVSDGYLPLVAELMQELRKTLGLDILMVTHKRVLSEGADHCYHTEIEDGKTALLKDW